MPILPMILMLVLLTVQDSALALANQGGEPRGKESIFDQLQYQEVLEVQLEMDLSLVLDRRSDEKYPAVFSFTDEQGNAQSWDIKVGLRGKFRRTKCAEMPPLKLDFKKKDLEAAGLAKFDEMKLVTHCVEDEALAKQTLIKEYLAYKLYNQISEESFRVQFLKITYLDSKTGKKKKQYGFLIEDTSELRARLGFEKWENPIGIDVAKIDQERLQKVALFEAMIGNVDWSIEKAHNVKVMDKKGKAIFIPYDFDFSGIVKAPYVTINTEIGQNSLDDRIYLADPSDLENMTEIFSFFENKQELLIKAVKDLKLLNFEAKKECINYLNDFFKADRELKLPLRKKESL